MKVSGFSFVRNGIAYDYPFLESIRSLLPLCDELVIAVGQSDDATFSSIQSLHSSKIVIIPTVWDDSLRSAGAVLAQQTNVALERVTGDWAVYLQADEILHENDLPEIRKAMQENIGNTRVEGLLFSYKHFYGSYEYVGSSRRWYRNEIRIVRPGTGVRSWGDAQGFRIGGRKLNVRPVAACIYHYGWVRPPQVQQTRQRSFHRLWHSDEWVQRHVGSGSEFDYRNSGRLTRFTGTHPAVMRDRVKRQHWPFSYNPSLDKVRLKDWILDWFESKTGFRIGEYRNYRIL
ncbi:MAG: glycosyltransferase family A protein [Bacteroidota bacterium]